MVYFIGISGGAKISGSYNKARRFQAFSGTLLGNSQNKGILGSTIYMVRGIMGKFYIMDTYPTVLEQYPTFPAECGK